MAKKNQKNSGVPNEQDEEQKRHASDHDREHETANPPRTTTGPMTSPKFGSAGSGGAELEPGPRKN